MKTLHVLFICVFLVAGIGLLISGSTLPGIVLLLLGVLDVYLLIKTPYRQGRNK